MLTSDFRPAAIAASRLGFGGAAIGLTNYLGAFDAASAASREASMAALRLAVANGVTYFDTAPGYGQGLSEEIMGEALSGVAGIVLATKVPISAAADVRGSLEASLRRLRRPRVDLLQIHGNSFDDATVANILGRGGMLEQMQRLRDEGLIGAIGFTSEDNNGGVYDLIRCGGFETMQLAYNLLLQHPYEPTRPFGSLFEAKKHGLFTIAMRATTSGIFQKWVKLVNPADDFNYAPALIQFVLSNPLIDVALVGMRTTADVESSSAIWRDEAGRVDISEIWGRYVPDTAKTVAR
jgi:aryl-alcohol dehydrogenase-like predicted oxidoreductase